MIKIDWKEVNVVSTRCPIIHKDWILNNDQIENKIRCINKVLNIAECVFRIF